MSAKLRMTSRAGRTFGRVDPGGCQWPFTLSTAVTTVSSDGIVNGHPTLSEAVKEEVGVLADATLFPEPRCRPTRSKELSAAVTRRAASRDVTMGHSSISSWAKVTAQNWPYSYLKSLPGAVELG
jgi:hypothetical protein